MDGLPLPDELLVDVLSRLSVKDVIRSTAASTRLRRIGRDSAVWGRRTLTLTAVSAETLSVFGHLVGPDLRCGLADLTRIDASCIPQVELVALADAIDQSLPPDAPVYGDVVTVDGVISGKRRLGLAGATLTAMFPNVTTVSLWCGKLMADEDITTLASLPHLASLTLTAGTGMHLALEVVPLTKRVLDRLPRLATFTLDTGLYNVPQTLWPWDTYLASWPDTSATTVVLITKVSQRSVINLADYSSRRRTGSLHVVPPRSEWARSTTLVVTVVSRKDA
jgi:hypothetical protein